MKQYHDRIDRLIEIPDRARRLEALRVEFSIDDPAEAARIAIELKERVIVYLQSDNERATNSAELAMDMGEYSGQETLYALGLRLVAQTHLICHGDVRTARRFYDRAIAIYETAGDELGRAETALTHVFALASEGNYEAAVREGDWAFTVLENHRQTRSLGTLINNLAYIHTREGQMQKALELYEQASRYYAVLGPSAEVLQTSTFIDRASLLHDLGRYTDAIEILETSIAWGLRNGNHVLLARARQSLGFTYHALGWYNRALKLLELAKQGWVADRREFELHRADFVIVNCMLELGRFEEVIPICERVREYFQDQGALYETGRLHLNQARAEIGIGKIEDALSSLAIGKEIFLQIGNRHEAAQADLFAAELHHRIGNWEECLSLSLGSREVFAAEGSPVDATAAILLAGSSSLAIGDLDSAKRLAREAQAFAQPHGTASFNYQVFHLLGRIASTSNQPELAAEHFLFAIDELERLERRMMIEFRPHFLDDNQKKGLFEAAVQLALVRKDWSTGLNLVERAKSRALFDIIANRIDLEIRPSAPEDEPLVAEFNRLSIERNALARNVERTENDLGKPDATQLAHEKNKVSELEAQISEIRYVLLVRHADYAEQMEAFTPPEAERTLADLGEDTLILEYFSLEGRPAVFLVNNAGGERHVHSQRLEVDQPALQRLYASLRTNFAAAVYGGDRHLPGLRKQAQGLLRRCHELLLGPIAERLADFKHVIVSPYGFLHYLPFHAFFDGDRHLIEDHLVSYLPSAGFWSDAVTQAGEAGEVLTVGSSSGGRLPFAVEEARLVADIWGTAPLLEEAAAMGAVLPALEACRLFHCAAHAEFRADSPLFSGIELADSRLTTLEVFNLKLRASLVTLSACDTGKSVIGGGDEILGFIRAFFSAGAASLLLSQWAVEDRSTLLLMKRFYASLKSGETKAAALRQAQLALLNGEAGGDADRYRHPYYWAPFYLIGHAGKL